MFASLMMQAVNVAIYVQVAGAFIWLFVALLLERHILHQARRLAALEAEFTEFRCGVRKAIDNACGAIQAVSETCKLRSHDDELLRLLHQFNALREQAEDPEETDPAFTIPAGSDHPNEAS